MKWPVRQRKSRTGKSQHREYRDDQEIAFLDDFNETLEELESDCLSFEGFYKVAELASEASSRNSLVLAASLLHGQALGKLH